MERKSGMLPSTKLDFNKIERIGSGLIRDQKFKEAVDLYVCLCDGDDYFEAGWYAYQISYCYDQLGDKFMAKYWAGLAVRENPALEKYAHQRQKFSDVGILDLVSLSDII